MEETQRGTASENLRKFHVLNEYGVRVSTHTCSSTLSEAQCKAKVDEEAFVFQSEAAGDAARIQRYVRQEYDTSGRYIDKTIEPFNSGGGSEWATLSVVDRDEYGNVTDALGLHGVRTRAAFGHLGRPYYSWTQTSESGAGVASLVTYRWCDGAVACPTGAKYREEITRDGAPTQSTYYDVLARPIFVLTQTFNTESGKRYSGICTNYDKRGRAANVSIPAFAAETNGVPSLACSVSDRYRARTQYDALGRATLTTSPDGSTQQTVYDGLKTTFTDALAKSRSETRNPMGELVSSVDAANFELKYAYDAAGNAISIKRDAGNGEIVSSAAFDASGRKTSQSDPDAGSVTYTHNALGETLSQTRVDGSTITQTYDARGRIIRRNVSGGAGVGSLNTFEFDTFMPGTLRHELAFAAIDVVDRRHEYDTMGRPISTVAQISGVSHVTQVRYDARGRPWKQQDASGRWLKTEYTPLGFAAGICESDSADSSATCSGQRYQQTLETDARGNIVKEQRGGTTAMTVTRAYDYQTGRLTDVSAGVASGSTTNHAVYHEIYDWDVAGNLKSRDKAGQYKEKYTYDALHRLTKGVYLRLLNQTEVAESVAPLSFELSYDKLGNICRRTIGSQTSTYHYDGRAGCGLNGVGTSGGSQSASPHAATQFDGRLQSYDALGNQTFASYGGASPDRNISYTGDQQAYEIVKGNKKIRFAYGPDGQRAKREDFNAGTLETTTHYVGSVEVVTTGTQVKLRRYVAGVAVQEISNLTAAPTTTTKYLFHDHLGSVVRATTSQGAVLEGMDFGPFGERRGYADPRSFAPVPVATNRGFTGHEMLDGLDVVHMNGRIYDSRTWRFLQADPIVQAPNNSQSLNRYSYVWNNPLNATDPSGFIVQRPMGDFARGVTTVMAIVIAVYSGGQASEASLAMIKVAWAVGGGYLSGYMQTGSGQGGLQGAYTGVLFLGAGAIAGRIGLAPDSFGRALLHGFAGGIAADIGGGNFGHGFASAGMAKYLMGNFVTGDGPAAYVKVAIIGGTVSVATGGKFANGAATAAMQFAFNQLQASSQEEVDGVTFHGEGKNRLSSEFKSLWRSSKHFRGSVNIALKRWGRLRYFSAEGGDGTGSYSEEGGDITVDMNTHKIFVETKLAGVYETRRAELHAQYARLSVGRVIFHETLHTAFSKDWSIRSFFRSDDDSYIIPVENLMISREGLFGGRERTGHSNWISERDFQDKLDGYR